MIKKSIKDAKQNLGYDLDQQAPHVAHVPGAVWAAGLAKRAAL